MAMFTAYSTQEKSWDAGNSWIDSCLFVCLFDMADSQSNYWPVHPLGCRPAVPFWG
jgi:hypothetical protein